MQRHFYATAEDLLPVFDRAERALEMRYTLAGVFPSPEWTSYAAGSALPTLRAPAPCPNAIACPWYLVTPAQVQVNIRAVPLKDGRTCYAIDQLVNPDSITIAHGGFFRPNVLLYGRVCTVCDSDRGGVLYRSFTRSIAKSFVRVRAFWVGPEAYERLRNGCRLTIGAESPPEYDLAI